MSQEEMRLQLVSGDLKSGNLAWHSRLAEWTPISQLASVTLLDAELSEAPDPQASSYYDAEREEQSARRRSSRRSPAERIAQPVKAPAAEAAAPVRSGSRPESDRGRRVRRSSSRERSSEAGSSGFWGLLRTFFEN